MSVGGGTSLARDHTRMSPQLLLLTMLAVAPKGSSSAAAGPRLALTREGADFVVTSSAPPTWRMVIAGSKQASDSQPGAGTIRALYIPATATESIVEPTPKKFCCAGWGLDHLEWRYVDPGPPAKGVRAPSGTRAELKQALVAQQTPDRIILHFAGRWENISRFTRTVTVDPRGVAVRMEADWTGRQGQHSMWWLISLLRSSWVDGTAVTIHDADTAAVPLPIAKEKVFPLPPGIGFPYEITFPLKQGPLRHLVLRMGRMGEDSPEGLRYELWPETDGYFMFYPRWVKRGFEPKTYVFEYGWRFEGGHPAALGGAIQALQERCTGVPRRAAAGRAALEDRRASP